MVGRAMKEHRVLQPLIARVESLRNSIRYCIETLVLRRNIRYDDIDHGRLTAFACGSGIWWHMMPLMGHPCIYHRWSRLLESG